MLVESVFTTPELRFQLGTFGLSWGIQVGWVVRRGSIAGNDLIYVKGTSLEHEFLGYLEVFKWGIEMVRGKTIRVTIHVRGRLLKMSFSGCPGVLQNGVAEREGLTEGTQFTSGTT